MTRVLIRTIVLGLVLGSVSAVGMAKEIKKHVTFADPVMVNSTTIKAGTYDVTFDDQTGQLTVFKGKKVLATAEAKLEKMDTETRQVYSIWTGSSAGDAVKVLTSVTLKDGYQAKLVNTGQTSAGGSQ